jgi:hypothetical protein
LRASGESAQALQEEGFECPGNARHPFQDLDPDGAGAHQQGADLMQTNTRQLATGLLATLIAVSIAGAGCRSTGGPSVEAPPAQGTLAGTVRGPTGVAPVEGRLVEAVAVDTGARYGTRTNPVGAFSLLVPPGQYRLEVALAAGESVARAPGVVSVGPSELARDNDVILAGAGIVEMP